MYIITIKVKTSIAMSHREEEKIEEYLTDKGYEYVEIVQEEVESLT